MSELSESVTVTTPALVILNVASSAIMSAQATITWQTDVPATSEVEYGTTTAYGQRTGFDPALSASHSQTIVGLTANTHYHYRVHSRDSAGRLVTSGDFSFRTSATSQTGTFVNEVLATNLNFPVGLEFLPTGDLLILELGGRIARLRPGASQVDAAPFLQLTNVGSAGGEQGLMDLVLDPDFRNNRFYYIFYTVGTPNRDRVSRFTATADLTGTAAGSETVIYQDPEDADIYHHGGALVFGVDGKLYIATGEHFNGEDAQSLSSPRGKILRVNADGTIPTDNPFYDGAGPNRDDVWAFGLRNPFRAYLDPATGRFYIAD